MKNKIKKYVSSILIISLVVLLNPYEVHAEDEVVTNVTEETGFIDINNETGEGRELTFSEYVEEISELTNVSKEEIINKLIEDEIGKISVDSDIFISASSYGSLKIQALNILVAQSYYTDKFPFKTLKDGYFAGGVVYYTYTGTSGNRQISKINYVGMDCGYSGTYKSFSGDFYVNLETSSKIHWILSGAFYNTGATTNGFNVQIGLGQATHVGFNSSITTSFFDSIWQSGDRYSAPR